MDGTDKRYDRDYFDTWYRQRGIHAGAALRRKVALAVACAEYHLGRPLRGVLDIGCGEGVWRAPLLRLRPDLHYLGLDDSDYAVERYGRRRNLHRMRFAALAEQRFDRRFDLLVCADVLHYLGEAELRSGLSAFADLGCGVAFIEVYCAEDAIEGDLHGFHLRDAAWYRRRFDEAGLSACGSHCYLTPALRDDAAALEIAAAPARTRQR